MTPSLIYLVDDDQDLLDFLSVSLATTDCEVKTYSDGPSFLAALPNGPALDNSCVILDINMPNMDGLEVQTALKERNFTAPILFLTAHADVPLAVQAMQAGAADFIEKPIQPAELKEALMNIKTRAATPALSNDELVSTQETYQQLTGRERDVMQLIVRGASNKEAAIELDISPRTVEIYRATVMRKMLAPNLPDLVRKAIAIGVWQ